MSMKNPWSRTSSHLTDRYAGQDFTTKIRGRIDGHSGQAIAESDVFPK